VTLQFSKYTPAEPDWEAEIARQRASCDPEHPDGELYPVVFKFCSTRADAVAELLCRVRDANAKVGTPAANQIDRDDVPRSVDRLQRLGYVQGAIVSWVTPGVYPIWNAYRKESARRWEYRVSVWLTVLRDPKEIVEIIGDSERTPTGMFFRRQHVVRAVHARGVHYCTPFSVGKTHYHMSTADDPYPDWVDDKATMVCQMVDYDTAEDLACADDIDVWERVMRDNSTSRAASGAAAEVVQRYASERLDKLHKL